MERHDLFTSLIEANDHELETLSEDELISMLLILHLLPFKLLTYYLTGIPQAIFMFSSWLDMRSVTHTSFQVFDSEIDNLIRRRHIL